MNLNLHGKHALVCGSSKGIGKAAALELAHLGANVTLAARSADVLESVKAKLSLSEGQVHNYLIVDFSDRDDLQEKVQALVKQRPVHILINNTGGPPGGPITQATAEAFLQAFNNHLLCNHLLAQIVTPGMESDGYGRVINVISTSVKQPLAGLGVSNTIRGAVANWAKTMANELGGKGITVNNVLPGATATDRLAQIIQNKAAKTGQSEEQVAKAMQGAIPLGRFAEPTEVANAIAFLASPAGAYINGINLPVDGGRTKSL